MIDPQGQPHDPSHEGGFVSESFTEVTHKSWFQRIGESLFGVLIGLILLPVAGGLLFWNEGRAVQTARSLDEGMGAVMSVGNASIDPSKEGRLVHVRGTATTGERVEDPEFGVGGVGLRLDRVVEMYQYKEIKESKTETKIGGGQETRTTYRYERTWSKDPINSSSFRSSSYTNPPMRWRERTVYARDATLGVFRLDEASLRTLGRGDVITPNAASIARVGQTVGRPATVADGVIFLGANPSSPQIGDMRITFHALRPGPVTLVAGQSGDRLVPYQTKAGDKLLLGARGEQPADALFAEAHTANRVLTWILRGVGLLLFFVGFALIAGPIGTLADVIPPLGWLVGGGMMAIAGVLALITSSAVIAIAWFWYRPLLSLCIIGGGVAGALLARRLRRAPAPVPQPAFAPSPPRYDRAA